MIDLVYFTTEEWKAFLDSMFAGIKPLSAIKNGNVFSVSFYTDFDQMIAKAWLDGFHLGEITANNND